MTVQSNPTTPHANINVTPMIDILLVLLIVFMAIAPVRQSGLDAALPTQSTAPDSPRENPIVLEITRDGEYRLNSEAIAQDSFAGLLARIFERRADRVLFVKAAGDLDFSAVASAIDLAKGANTDRVALIPRSGSL